MRVIQLLADRTQLTVLELADLDSAPAVCGADDGRVHQLQHGALPERVRNDLRPAALLEEQPLEQVRIRYERSGVTRPVVAVGDALWCDHPGPGHLGARRLGRPVTYDELRARVSIWPPLRLARMRCERESVGVV